MSSIISKRRRDHGKDNTLKIDVVGFGGCTTLCPTATTTSDTVQEDLEYVAYHEAGHLVAGIATGYWDFEYATIVPGPDFAGRCWERVADLPVSPEARARRIILAMGGFVAGLRSLDLAIAPLSGPAEATFWGCDSDYARALELAECNHPGRAARYVAVLTRLTAMTLDYCWPVVRRVAKRLMVAGSIRGREDIERLVHGRVRRRSRVMKAHDRLKLRRFRGNTIGGNL